MVAELKVGIDPDSQILLYVSSLECRSLHSVLVMGVAGANVEDCALGSVEW